MGSSGIDAETIARELLSGGACDASRDAIVRVTPGWMVALAFVIIGLTYSVVNHTQAMRMFASRNGWHLKMSIFAASVPLLAMTFSNLSIGSSLSVLLARDAYARLLVRERDDRHYLRVGQWLTPVIRRGWRTPGPPIPSA